MATRVNTPVAGPELLQFRHRWIFDPVPDWLLDHLSPVAIREIAAINIRAQIQTLAIQQKSLEETLAVVNKAK